MKKSFFHSMLFCLLASGSLLLTACSTDDGIDLGELDMTIGVGQNNDGLVLPSSSTSQIKLTDVLSLNDDDVIKVFDKDSAFLKNGDFLYRMDGKDVKAAKPEVKQVSIKSDVDKDTKFGVDISAGMVALKGLVTAEGQYPMQGFDEKPIKEFTFNTDGDEAVLDLVSAQTEAVIDITLNFANLKSDIEIANININLPKFIAFSIDRTFAGMQTEKISVNKADNSLELKKVKTSQNVQVRLNIDSLVNFTTVVPDDPENSIFLALNKDDVKMRGNVTMDMKVDPYHFTNGIQVGHHDIDAKVTIGKLKSDGHRYIDIVRARGHFNPDIDVHIGDVNIGDDVPDFLSDDDAHIILANPNINLSVSSNVNVRGHIDGRIVAYYDDAKKDSLFATVSGINRIIVKPHTGSETDSTVTRVVICRKAGTDANTQYVVLNGTQPKSTTLPTEVTDIAKLLEKVPRSLSFSCDANVDKTYLGDISLYDPNDPNDKLGRNYSIDPSYQVLAPLALEAGSQIVYNDSIDDFNKDLVDNDIDFYNGGQLIINAKIYNGSPLKLNLDPKPFGLDKKTDGTRRELSSDDIAVEVMVNDQPGNRTVVSSYGSDESKATPLTIILSSSKPGAFKKLDGLAFNIKAESDKHGVTLNDNTQYIRIFDTKITLKGTVTINLDKKD